MNKCNVFGWVRLFSVTSVGIDGEDCLSHPPASLNLLAAFEQTTANVMMLHPARSFTVTFDVGDLVRFGVVPCPSWSGTR